MKCRLSWPAVVGLAYSFTVFLAATPCPAADGTTAKESIAARQRPLFDRVQVRDAWQITKGDPGVIVGVIDNGFDFFHPNLKGQVRPGFYYPGGYHTEYYENVAHGTWVASIIAARGDRPDGMTGLAPNCRVLTASQGSIEHTLIRLQQPYFQEYFRGHPKGTLADAQKDLMKDHKDELTKFQNDWMHYQMANLADAVRFLVDHGVRVINLSGGSFTRSMCRTDDWQRVEEAFDYAAQKNVVVVLAAGNSGTESEEYLGRGDTVIVAGATLLDDSRWEHEQTVLGTKIKQGSNYGKRLTVMAPVENIMVCDPHDRRVYETKDGPMGEMKMPFEGEHRVLPNGATSCAAPVVSALVALVFSVRPDLDARSAVEIVKKGCDPIGGHAYDVHTGHGRVNFSKTVRLAQGWETQSERRAPQ
jgi:thermitase